MANVNGEHLTEAQTQALIDIFKHDCEEFAGQFYDMNRSAKFRANWPDQYEFAQANWKTFWEATRHIYVEQLRSPSCPEEKKEQIAKILILIAAWAIGKETDNRSQLAPNTQQFAGDAYENKKIAETYGTGQNLRAQLLRSTALH